MNSPQLSVKDFQTYLVEQEKLAWFSQCTAHSKSPRSFVAKHSLGSPLVIKFYGTSGCLPDVCPLFPSSSFKEATDNSEESSETQSTQDHLHTTENVAVEIEPHDTALHVMMKVEKATRVPMDRWELYVKKTLCTGEIKLFALHGGEDAHTLLQHVAARPSLGVAFEEGSVHLKPRDLSVFMVLKSELALFLSQYEQDVKASKPAPIFRPLNPDEMKSDSKESWKQRAIDAFNLQTAPEELSPAAEGDIFAAGDERDWEQYYRARFDLESWKQEGNVEIYSSDDDVCRADKLLLRAQTVLKGTGLTRQEKLLLLANCVYLQIDSETPLSRIYASSSTASSSIVAPSPSLRASPVASHLSFLQSSGKASPMALDSSLILSDSEDDDEEVADESEDEYMDSEEGPLLVSSGEKNLSIIVRVFSIAGPSAVDLRLQYHRAKDDSIGGPNSLCRVDCRCIDFVTSPFSEDSSPPWRNVFVVENRSSAPSRQFSLTSTDVLALRTCLLGRGESLNLSFSDWQLLEFLMIAVGLPDSSLPTPFVLDSAGKNDRGVTAKMFVHVPRQVDESDEEDLLVSLSQSESMWVWRCLKDLSASSASVFVLSETSLWSSQRLATPLSATSSVGEKRKGLFSQGQSSTNSNISSSPPSHKSTSSSGLSSTHHGYQSSSLLRLREGSSSGASSVTSSPVPHSSSLSDEDSASSGKAKEEEKTKRSPTSVAYIELPSFLPGYLSSRKGGESDDSPSKQFKRKREQVNENVSAVKRVTEEVNSDSSSAWKRNVFASANA